MKFRLGTWILFFAVALGVSAQELPKTNPREVWVKGRFVQHSWRDGRIHVATNDLQPLLGFGSEFRQMDLIESLEKKGGYIWTFSDGKFEAKRDTSNYSFVDSSQARARNKRHEAHFQGVLNERFDPAMAKDFGLRYEVVEVDTDWGYKWGAVRVTNDSGQVSQPCRAYCEFQDGFGRTYAEDWWPVKSLQPGESLQFEISSGVRTEDTSITPTSDNIAVYFVAPGSKNNPTSRREAMQQAKKNKKPRGMKRANLNLRNNEVKPQDQTRSGIGW